MRDRKVVSLATIRANKERRDDSSRLSNQALVTPTMGDDRDEKCFIPRCQYFAEYDVIGTASMHGLACRYHLDDYIHRFFDAEHAGKPISRRTYSDVGMNPEWKDWERAKWRLEYRRGQDEVRSRRDFPTRPVTKRQIKKAERAAYENALKGE